MVLTDREDVDRSRELRRAAKQSVTLLLIFTVAIIGLHPGMGLSVFLILGSTFLISYRAWALMRFSPSSAAVYARIFATNYLNEILEAINDDADLRTLLGASAAACAYLARVGGRARKDATSILRGAGYPSRRPIPLISLLGTLISFTLGAVIGAWLPTTSLSAAFIPLCDTSSVVGALVSPWHLLLQVPLMLVLAAVVALKAYAVINNRAQIRQAHEFLRSNVQGELRGILAGPTWNDGAFCYTISIY